MRRTLFWSTTLCVGVVGSWITPSRPAQLPCRSRAQLPVRHANVVLDASDVGTDGLISQLRSSPPDQLPKLLADNLKNIDQRLFLRLAEMSDAETDEYEKLRIRQLATTVASTLETILEQADKQMSADAEQVQGLMRALALGSGEFELPVPAAQLASCRAEIVKQLPQLDEGFVGTVKAYMRKASDDGLESMVDVLRVLLQLFAAERLRSLAGGQVQNDGVQSAISTALDARPEEWDVELRKQCTSDSAVCTAQELIDTLQDKMGEVVLGMPAGSATQSVIAEYLNELLDRARAIAAEE